MEFGWCWLSGEESNLRIAESKSAALPLGYPIIFSWTDLLRVCDLSLNSEPLCL